MEWDDEEGETDLLAMGKAFARSVLRVFLLFVFSIYLSHLFSWCSCFS